MSGVNTGATVNAEMYNEFIREFWNEPEEAIESAFKTWRREITVPAVTPMIGEIRKLIDDWKFNQREIEAEKKRKAEKAALEEGRKQGKVPELREVLAQLGELAGKMKIPEHERKLQESRSRNQNSPFSIPTIAPRLTAEQIAARREKEREEIERYKKEAGK